MVMLLKQTTKFVVANRTSLFVASQHRVRSAAMRVMHSSRVRSTNWLGAKFDIYTVEQWEFICNRVGVQVRVG